MSKEYKLSQGLIDHLDKINESYLTGNPPITISEKDKIEIPMCEEEKEDPFKTQIGGTHYKEYKIQPYEFFFKNNIPHHKAAIIRRILRYDHPTGKGLEDLEKIKHEIDLIIKLEEF